jgi:hypothetical protein
MTPATVAQTTTYRCTFCEADWSYDDVRYLARCRACGNGLRLRTPDQATDPSATHVEEARAAASSHGRAPDDSTPPPQAISNPTRTLPPTSQVPVRAHLRRSRTRQPTADDG